METIRCPDCLESIGEDELECPFCGAELFVDAKFVQDEDELVDEEPVGPEPREYKPVLIFAIVLVLAGLVWAWLSDPAFMTAPYLAMP